MAFPKRKILRTAIIYGVLVFMSEITLGNPDFPINFWIFVNIAQWKWSIPVHLSGLLWLILWNFRLKDKSIIWSVLVASLFFIMAETLNWFVFGFFKYSDDPFGKVASFWIIITLYIILCTLCSFLLRMGNEDIR